MTIQVLSVNKLIRIDIDRTNKIKMCYTMHVQVLDIQSVFSQLCVDLYHHPTPFFYEKSLKVCQVNLRQTAEIRDENRFSRSLRSSLRRPV